MGGVLRVAASTGRAGGMPRDGAGAAAAGELAGLLTCAGNTALALAGVVTAAAIAAGAPGWTTGVAVAGAAAGETGVTAAGCVACAAGAVDAAAAVGAGAASTPGDIEATAADDLLFSAATIDASVAGAGLGLAAEVDGLSVACPRMSLRKKPLTPCTSESPRTALASG
jgi:hypothetical protein